jgi:hypothetical protein
MIYLKCIILYYPPAYISKHAEEIMAEMHSFGQEDRLELVKALGIAFIKAKPTRPNIKLQFLNFGWETLGLTKNSSKFMEAGTILVEFAIKNMKQESVNNFITEIFKRFRDFVKIGEDEELY